MVFHLPTFCTIFGSYPAETALVAPVDLKHLAENVFLGRPTISIDSFKILVMAWLDNAPYGNLRDIKIGPPGILNYLVFSK